MVYHTGQALSQVKDSLASRVFQGRPNRLNNENSLEMGLGKSSDTPLLSLMVATGLLFFALHGVSFKATVEG